MLRDCPSRVASIGAEVRDRAESIRGLAARARLFELADNDEAIAALLKAKLRDPADRRTAQVFEAELSLRVALASRAMVEQSDFVIAILGRHDVRARWRHGHVLGSSRGRLRTRAHPAPRAPHRDGPKSLACACVDELAERGRERPLVGVLGRRACGDSEQRGQPGSRAMHAFPRVRSIVHQGRPRHQSRACTKADRGRLHAASGPKRRKIALAKRPGECMRNHSGWRAVAIVFVVGFVNGCAESPNEAAGPSPNAPAANVQAAPVMTVNQLMRGILFPLGNAVFFAQADDPEALPRDAQPSASPNPLTGLFGGWQAVENSALALAESADLLLIAGRTCSNGEVVDVEQADWIRFVDDFRRDSVAAYEAALTKDQDAMVDASGALSEACLACHRVYRREPTPGDATERCISGSPVAPR